MIDLDWDERAEKRAPHTRIEKQKRRPRWATAWKHRAADDTEQNGRTLLAAIDAALEEMRVT